jgi:hypothetical protein
MRRPAEDVVGPEPGPPSGGRMSTAMSQGLIVAWALVHVVIAWYPFEFEPPRYVQNSAVVVDEGLLFLGDRAVATAERPSDWDALETLRVEVTARTELAEQVGPARILTVARDHRRANLMIGQYGPDLVVRVRRASSDRLGRPELHVPDVFAEPTWQRIRVDVDQAVRVRVNGDVQVEELPAAPFPLWSGDYPISLGDERTGDRAWQGQIREARVVVNGDAHDLVPAGALDIPDEVWFVPSRLYDTLERPDRRSVLRSLLHLLAFVPAGVLIAVAAHRPSAWRVVLWTGAFALLLQVVKIVIAGRHPSVLVVVTQPLGAIAGLRLSDAVLRRLAC